MLHAVVFTTGCCLLIIEVLATRILSPYFGNTIFTFSSVISVVLLALSIGYYVGGKMADKHPSYSRFYGIILASGVSSFLLTGMSVTLLPLWAYTMSLVMGPLLSSVILFVIPGFLLGMLSPFAIKLQQEKMKDVGIGTVAGSMFFWSTLGSISGSLSAGFFFVPFIGTFETLLAVSTVLTGLGLFGMIHYRNEKQHHVDAMMAIIVPLSLAGALLMSAPTAPGTVYAADGLYEKIQVRDGEFKDRPTRFLLLDRSFSSAEFLDGEGIVFDYAEYLRLHQIFVDDMDRALVLGAGAFTLPVLLLEDNDNVEVDTVDIEPELETIAKAFFGVRNDPRLHSFVGDGRRFLHDTPHKYDVIFGDAYASLYSLPVHLTTQEFFELLRKKLSADGIFIGNFIVTLERADPSLWMAEMQTFRSVFPNSYFFAANSAGSSQPQNVIFIGVNGEQEFDPCEKKYTRSENDFFASMCKQQIALDRFEGIESTIFTDWYAPVEHYSTSLIQYAKPHRLPFRANEARMLIEQLQHLSPVDEQRLIELELAAMDVPLNTVLDEKHIILRADRTNLAAKATAIELARELMDLYHAEKLDHPVALEFVEKPSGGNNVFVVDGCNTDCSKSILKKNAIAVLKNIQIL